MRAIKKRERERLRMRGKVKKNITGSVVGAIRTLKKMFIIIF